MNSNYIASDSDLIKTAGRNQSIFQIATPLTGSLSLDEKSPTSCTKKIMPLALVFESQKEPYFDFTTKDTISSSNQLVSSLDQINTFSTPKYGSLSKVSARNFNTVGGQSCPFLIEEVQDSCQQTVDDKSHVNKSGNIISKKDSNPFLLDNSRVNNHKMEKINHNNRCPSEPNLINRENLDIEVTALKSSQNIKVGKKTNQKVGKKSPSNRPRKKSINKRRDDKLTDLQLKNKPLDLLSDFLEYQRQNPERYFDLRRSSASQYGIVLPSKFDPIENRITDSIRNIRKKIANFFFEKPAKQKKRKTSFEENVGTFWSYIKKPIIPEDKIRLIWDILLISLVLIDMVVLPLQISFSILEDLNAFQRVCDAAFFMDIFLSFHTAYYKAGNLVTSHSRIAKRYIKTWLVIDIIAAFPFYSLESEDASTTTDLHQPSFLKLFRLIRLLRILRALKFFKLNKLFIKIKAFFGSSPSITSLFQMLKLLTIVLILAHWLASAWHLVAVLELDFSESLTWLESKDLAEADPLTRYLYSLYWAVTTMLTVGYGDITPVTQAEVGFTIFAMFFGCAIFAYSLNSINLIIQGLNKDEEDISSNIYAVNRFMQKNRLSKEIQERVRGYMDHMIEDESSKKQYREKFLSLMPDNLKKDILIDLHGNVLAHDSIFNGNFDSALLNELSSKILEKTFCIGEVVYYEETRDTSFYIITRGKMELYLEKTKQTIKTLKTGEHFGEVAFFSGFQRTVGVRSSNYSQVFYLEQQTFLEALERYENDKERFHEIKDKIRLYHDYSPLKVKCLCCALETHTLKSCPMLQYRPDFRSVLNTVNEEQNIFMKEFVRRPKRSLNARATLYRVNQAARQINVELHRQNPVNINLITSHNNSKKGNNISIYFNQAVDNEKQDHTHARNLSDIHITSKPLGFEEDNAEIHSNISAVSSARGLMSPLEARHIKSDVGLVLTPFKRQNNEEDVYDQVKSFKRYFAHNNVEGVVSKINVQNRMKHFDPSRLEKLDQQGIIDLQVCRKDFRKRALHSKCVTRLADLEILNGLLNKLIIT